MIKVTDKVNANKSIKAGNVVEITECPNIVEQDALSLKAILIKDVFSYKLLNMYTFHVIKQTSYSSLEELIEDFGLVFYSDNISLIIE